MHRVYICSPLGGNVSANIENAKRYARYALEVRYGSVHTAFLCADFR